MDPFNSLVAKFCAPTAIGILALSGCVTRTVYVVDDSERPSASAVVPAAATAPPPVSVGGGGAPTAYEDDVGIVDDSDFYEPLSGYGTWVAYPGYGRVWRPSVTIVGSGFRPYTHGHWENTEWGWTWVDHHPFGWATGHYGRWLYDSSYGWVWVPGTVWSPAWVSWRTGGGYVGWSAMPPGAVYGGSYAVYDTSWVFVSNGHFGAAYVGGVIITGPAYRTCYASTYDSRSTYVVYGRPVYRGPDYEEIRREGQVIHRPLRETERERAVSRPPAGTVIARGRDRDRDPTRGRDDDRARGRDDDRARGRDDDNARGRDDDRARGRDDDDSASRGRGRDSDDNSGRDRQDGRDRTAAGAGIDDRGGPAEVRDRPVDADGRATSESAGRDRDRDGAVSRDSALVHPERPDAIGDNNDHDVPRPIRPGSIERDDDAGNVVQPVPPESISENNDRNDVVVPRPRPVTPPALRGDVRAPEPEKPTKSYLEDPARFPSAGRAVKAPTARLSPAATDHAPAVERSPSRAPSVDRAPTSVQKAPRPAVEAHPEPAEDSATTAKKKKKTEPTKPKAKPKKR